MLQFSISLQLKEYQIVFTIKNKEELDLSLQCHLKAYQLSSSFISLQILNDLLAKQIARLNFSLQDFQLQIIIPVGKIKRYIYIPIGNDDPQINRLFLVKSMEKLQSSLKDIQINGSNQIAELNKQIQKASEQYQNNRDSWCQKKCITRAYEQQISTLIQEDLKLNRQILVIDEEIMSCKRGLELEQYRLQTSSENRQQRKKKVHLSELGKLTNPKIQKIIRDKNHSLTRLELGQCELRSMKFVEIFQSVQELKLPKNLIRKIEGLTTLVQLRKVQLEGNVIEKIEGFNNNLEIRQIKLQRNRIARLQNIFHLCRLQILALSQNLMDDIPREIKMLEGLVELRLINNNINHLPGELLSLNKLRTLSILGNPCLKENHKSKDLLKKLAMAQVETSCTVS